MKILDRIETSKRLGMTPAALSCHVSRRGWETGAIPMPVKIGNRWKWIDEKVTEFIQEKWEEGQSSTSNKKRGPGRPRKTRSMTC
ncbi:MAG: hypothetical protein CL942_08430 [Desulfovibrio sp.]|nr:hypothetical protein [Desulfovibrio sp.]|tara:strand:+ start:383 stop:637 length:255 start_codon:yes stop_codon:yes gene_type:complete